MTTTSDTSTRKTDKLTAHSLMDLTRNSREELNLNHEQDLLTNFGDEKKQRYQKLSDELREFIMLNARERIIGASSKGHGWTNLFQYLPTNHPAGLARIMPTEQWKIDDFSLKFFAGLDENEAPIQSTASNGVPIILLIQGPKIGSNRNIDILRKKGLNPVMDQLAQEFKQYFPGVKIVHRWVGKNGYILEAVWDHAGYEKKTKLQNNQNRAFKARTPTQIF